MLFFSKMKEAKGRGANQNSICRLHLRTAAIWPQFVFARYTLCALNSFYRKFETPVCFAPSPLRPILFFAGMRACVLGLCWVRYAPPLSPPTLSYLKIQDGKREEEEERGKALTLPFVLRWHDLRPDHIHVRSRCGHLLLLLLLLTTVSAKKKLLLPYSKEKCYVTGGQKKDKRRKKTTSVSLLPTRRSSKSFPDRVGGEKLYWHEFANFISTGTRENDERGTKHEVKKHVHKTKMHFREKYT